MNCKQGDLALVIRGPDTGKVVSVVLAVSPQEYIPTSLGIFGISLRALPENLPAWHVDREMAVRVFGIDTPATARVAWDSCLLPIRPPPAAADTDTAEREVTEGCGA